MSYKEIMDWVKTSRSQTETENKTISGLNYKEIVDQHTEKLTVKWTKINESGDWTANTPWNEPQRDCRLNNKNEIADWNTNKETGDKITKIRKQKQRQSWLNEKKMCGLKFKETANWTTNKVRMEWTTKKIVKWIKGNEAVHWNTKSRLKTLQKTKKLSTETQTNEWWLNHKQR